MTNIPRAATANKPHLAPLSKVAAPPATEATPLPERPIDRGHTDLAAMAAAKKKASGVVDLSWRPELKPAELDALEARMLQISDLIVKKSAPADAELELAAMLDKLEAPVAVTKERLDALQANMKVQQDTLNWWARNIDNPASYDDKQKVEGALRSWLEQAVAIRGGARIALRIRQEQKPTRTPEDWQSHQDQLHQAALGSAGAAGWSKDIAGLARFQAELKNEAAASRAEANGRANDLDQFDDLTWFWQRSKVLDIITFGESEKGRVFRAGKTQAASADDLADRFQTTFGVGEDRLHGSINQLLKKEDPSGYGVTRAQYDLVKPAFDSLRAVQSQARTVRSKLDDVDSAISHAAFVRMQEPSETVTRRDAEGKLETILNPDHDSWESRVQRAESAIISAKSDASSAVSRLNGMLPGLSQRLSDADLRACIGQVSSDLATWNNWLGAFGRVTSRFGGWASWSYDQGQVSSVRSDVQSLELKLAPVDAILTPKYEGLHNQVWQRMGERRAELVQKGE